MHHFYKSEAPEVVAIVQEFYQEKELLNKRMADLGKLFGGSIAPMRDVTSYFAGGVKLSASRELDVHWCRPDERGYRSLRQQAVPPKGITKDQRSAIRAEHERLRELWKEHCPSRLDSHDYWNRLDINTGNLLLCGGIKFVHQGISYFCLGFEINQARHEANSSAGKPSAGWITGAVEILPSEYEAARLAKVGGAA
ncbi:hypothetical protein WLF18_18510 [Pseudomonas shirazensis]|uniref:HNH endonuclease n=1 Tax=Pseudomonas shirazensis TaxID=2745494 RepID=A0ABU9A3C3_9PSED